MNWPAVKQGFSDAGTKAKAFADAHPVIVWRVGCFVAGFVVGFVLG